MVDEIRCVDCGATSNEAGTLHADDVQAVKALVFRCRDRAACRARFNALVPFDAIAIVLAKPETTVVVRREAWVTSLEAVAGAQSCKVVLA